MSNTFINYNNANIKKLGLLGGGIVLLFQLNLVFAGIVHEDPDESGKIYSKTNHWVYWDEFGWRSRNNNLNDLSAELSDLYLKLFNFGRLPARLIVDEGGRTIEKLFRDYELFFGGYFPLELDALACDMNPHICTREREAVSSKKVLEDYEAHVGGYIPSRGYWRNKYVDYIFLPNIRFNITDEITTYHKTSGESLKRIVLIKRLGCVQFDDECQSYLDFLNREQPTYKDLYYSGPIRVPTLQISTIISNDCGPVCVGGIRDSGIVPKVFANIFRENLGKPLFVINKNKEYFQETENLLEKIQKNIQLDRAFNKETRLNGIRLAEQMEFLLPGSVGVFDASSLDSNIFVPIRNWKINSPSLEGESSFNSQRVMFEFMKFPFIDVDYPTEYQVPTKVGVFDLFVDKYHCDFWEENGWDVQNITTFDESNRAQCDTDELRDADKTQDHGSHVVGIIAAKMNGKGTVGINPYAQIYASQLNMVNFGKHDYQEVLRDKLKGMIRRATNVVNFSNEYFPERRGAASASVTGSAASDPVHDAIQNHEKDILIVAAAGNQAREYRSSCDIYPACFETNNVISVIGVEGDRDAPQLMPESNWGEKFDIAALGRDIFSTGTGNTYVTLSGTSQATPQVAAIASLLFSRYRRSVPVQVKNRLIACADLYNHLKKKVYSGVLNANCTLLNTDHEWIKLSNGQEFVGEIIKFKDTAENSLEFRQSSTNIEFKIKWKDIYAMHYDPEFQQYRVYKVTDPSNRAYSNITKYEGLELLSDNFQLVFKDKDNQPHYPEVKEITRFITKFD